MGRRKTVKMTLVLRLPVPLVIVLLVIVGAMMKPKLLQIAPLVQCLERSARWRKAMSGPKRVNLGVRGAPRVAALLGRLPIPIPVPVSRSQQATQHCLYQYLELHPQHNLLLLLPLLLLLQEQQQPKPLDYVTLPAKEGQAAAAIVVACEIAPVLTLADLVYMPRLWTMATMLLGLGIAVATAAVALSWLPLRQPALVGLCWARGSLLQETCLS
mmetsp:Transcript_16058/g.27090  ORF Transcript_16058/g.27090 Transcript_16058/m.27090 type:complete len:214 (+) Transcript_16058:40-681(+)